MGVILDPKIPYSAELKKAIVIRYQGHTLVTTEEAFRSGDYRTEFIIKFGVCLPIFEGKTTVFFSPNLEEIIDVDMTECTTGTCAEDSDVV